MRAFITGASAGIGAACARKLSAAGWQLILVARREDRLQDLAKELKGEHLLLPVDLCDTDELERQLEGLAPEWRDLDLLLNNAGMALGTEPLQCGAPEDWDRVIDLNVRALLRVTRVLLPGMIERGRGQIINIGSIAGRQTYPGGGVYCASKAAELAISRGLGMDLLQTPIRVTSIDPGLVETEFSEVRFRGDKDKAKAVYQDLEALTGDDIADAVLWVSSRPAHVQVSEMVIFPTCQASAFHVHRGPLGS